MNFQAYTIAGNKVGQSYMHSSDEVWDETRRLFTRHLSLDRTTVLHLDPHFRVVWEPGNGAAFASFYWRDVPICMMLMVYSNRVALEALLQGIADHRRLAQSPLPAAFMKIRDEVAAVDPNELHDALRMLGDLDRCIACVYFELMENRTLTIQ